MGPACPVCGGELEGPHVRFHYAPPFEDGEGHYVDAPQASAPAEGHQAREDGQRAPAPGPKPKGAQLSLEEDLRWDGIALLRQLGYRAYNLEQGYRPGAGHTRVGKGIPDAYFHGHGVRGWIEFKRWDNDQTPEQKEFERWELEAGGVYLLVYEVDQIARWHAERDCVPNVSRMAEIGGNGDVESRKPATTSAGHRPVTARLSEDATEAASALGASS